MCPFGVNLGEMGHFKANVGKMDHLGSNLVKIGHFRANLGKMDHL